MYYMHAILLVYVASMKRQKYMDLLGSGGVHTHEVDRASIIDSLFNVYDKGIPTEYVNFEYVHELAVDSGGVSRDVYSTFWEQAYQKFFDGVCCVIPAMTPNIDMSLFLKLGGILSHGYLTTGFLPVMISFPSLCIMLLGTEVSISDDLFISSFLNFVSNRESAVLQEALSSQCLPPSLKTKLSDILGCYGCFQVPSVGNLRSLLCQVSRFEVIQKPLALLQAINSGIPAEHTSFWKKYDANTLYNLYTSMTCDAEKILDQLLSNPVTQAEQCSVLYVILNSLLVI